MTILIIARGKEKGVILLERSRDLLDEDVVLLIKNHLMKFNLQGFAGINFD